MIRLAVRVAGEHAEEVLAELLELAPAGVEELRGDGTSVEYVVYGAPGELPALPQLQARAGDALIELSTSEIPDDWHERWREFHRPVLIEAPPAAQAQHPPIASLRIRPPWEPPAAERARCATEIVIDPGQAFGTGGHATTRLCLQLLLELAAVERERPAALDVGTGSGVLAIAAAMLGYAPVLALDNEQESVAAARENAAVNGVAVDVRRLDIRSDPPPWPADARADASEPLVLANLLGPLLLELARRLPGAPAHLIAGGVLVGELDEVAGELCSRLGMRERARRHDGEWAAVWLSAGA